MEPRARPFVKSRLFNTQSINAAHQLRRDLEAYNAEFGPANIAFITIRPSTSPTSKTGPLLNEHGHVPLARLRECHCAAADEVQRALEEASRRSCFVPLVVGRHADAVNGGAAFDCHTHVTVILEPDQLRETAEFLEEKFGKARVWISSKEKPEEVRDLVATGCYSARQLANKDYDDIRDEHLVEFFRQSAGLRTIEVVGPLRSFRKTRREAAHGHDSKRPSQEQDMRESLPAREELEVQTGVASAEPRVLRVCQAYLGLSLRWVARVENYAGWDDLCARYDMTENVAYAKAFAKRAEHYLYSNPVIPEALPSTSAHEHAVSGRAQRDLHVTSSTDGNVADVGAPWTKDEANEDEATAFESTSEMGAQAPEGAFTTNPETKAGNKGAEAAGKPGTRSKSDTHPAPTTSVRVDRMPVDICDVLNVELAIQSRGDATASVRVGLAPLLLAAIGRATCSREASPPS